MGFFSCCSSKKVRSSTGEKPKGVSVYFLRNGFMEEVKSTEGLSEISNIYEIENLSSKECGVIRSKGKEVICPRDGRLGAAYVDCIDGQDNVGPANLMLSYGWRYAIKDIVDTLEDYCDGANLDTKRTYVWICCLCNNQHRVVESLTSGNKQEDTFDQFQQTFHDRVVDIGHVVAMMYPWRNPIYLTRIWCIFELYVASENENCTLTIHMPPNEKAAMIKALRQVAGVDDLYRHLSKTKIENAEASEELDRQRILEIVRQGPGFNELNQKVNMLIRDWVKRGLLESVENYKRKSNDYSNDPEYARLCNDVGKVMRDNTEMDIASVLHHDAIQVLEKCDEQGILTDEYRRVLADTYNNLGLLLKSMGEYAEAKGKFQKALEIGKTVWSENDYDAAQTYNNIGLALDDMKDYDNALDAYQEAQKLVELSLGKDHPNVAGAISNIAYLLEKMGRRDEAIEKMKQVIEIDEKSNGFDHPDTANSYNILGVILTENGDYEGALEQYHKALAVREKVFGKDSLLTATSYHNIGSVYYDIGKYDDALKELQKAYDIYDKNVGSDHPECAVTKTYLEMVKKVMI